jgi:hypothetical protein
MAKVFKLAPWPGLLVFTTDCDEFTRLYNKRGGLGGEDHKDSLGLTWNDGGYTLVGVFDDKLTTLVHELGHASMDVLNYARTGDYTQGHNQEQFCYLLSYLVGLTAPLIKGN